MQLNASKSKWGGGYVTDISYLPGYYRHQSPLHLHLACLLGGVSAPDLGPGTPLCYLELGCAHGLSALALAVCNPSWRVTGIDFNRLTSLPPALSRPRPASRTSGSSR